MIFLEPCATRHPATGIANNCYLIPDIHLMSLQLSESEKTGRKEDMLMNEDGKNTLEYSKYSKYITKTKTILNYCSHVFPFGSILVLGFLIFFYNG